MQITIDSLVLALLVALAPEQEPGHGNDRILDGMLTEPQSARPAALAGPQPPSACQYFVDSEARRKCAIRTSRTALSGAAEPHASYPETVIWLTPLEPRMPMQFGPNPQR
jgi:hypothetical protein